MATKRESLRLGGVFASFPARTISRSRILNQWGSAKFPTWFSWLCPSRGTVRVIIGMTWTGGYEICIPRGR